MTPITFPPAAAAMGASSKSADHPNKSKISDAATQFEALILQQLLRSARESPESQSGIFSSGQTNDTFSSMAEEHFAQALAAKGGIGLARLVAGGLLREHSQTQNNRPPAAVPDSSGAKP